MHSVCLAAYPSVFIPICAYFNSCKYSSNVLKFMYVIDTWNGMHRIKNGMYRAKNSSKEMHESFWCFTAYRAAEFLNCMLTYL